MTQKKIILLACGSFNPPTFLHLRMFEIAKDTLTRQGYNVVGGIMSPVHDGYGKKELASATHRCEMIRLALHSSTWVRLSEWESKQESWVPTRQVLQQHQNQINSLISVIHENSSPQKRQRRDDTQWLPADIYACTEGPVHVKLLCGADLLESFGTPGLWKNEDLESIVGDHGLVVITRDATNPYKFIYESDMLTKFQNNIQIVTEWIANEVSSTKIRRALRRGESVKYLIPDSVVAYVEQHALYSTEENKYRNNKPSSLSLYPTPSPSDVLMNSASPTLYLNEMNIQMSNEKSGNYLGLPEPYSIPKPSPAQNESSSTADLGVPERNNTKLPRQAVPVEFLEVRPLADGATDILDSSDATVGDTLAEQLKPHIETTSKVASKESKVQIQFTKDGIKVISDRETTV